MFTKSTLSASTSASGSSYAPLLLEQKTNSLAMHKMHDGKSHEKEHSQAKDNKSNPIKHACQSASDILFKEILKRKNLDINMFTSNDVTLEDDISRHVAWAYEHIYSKPYLNDQKSSDSIARVYHGIQHVTRAAIYIPIFANLFRRHNDAKALKLTDEDIKLLQIAALFHDAARENEDVDLWDKESGLLLYYYLTDVLKVDTKRATLLAEAVANKDSDAKHYSCLVKNENNQLIWRESKEPREKNIYQKLIHDADCLDIIRARDHFDASYLDFYQDIAKSNISARDEMATLICEARSLIEIHGDGRKGLNWYAKQEFEHEQAYQATMQAIASHQEYIVIQSMHAKNKLLDEKALQRQLIPNDSTTDFKDTKEMNPQYVAACMRQGKLLARAVASPSAVRKKDGESFAHLEVRKTLRRPWIKTKAGHLDKDGNPNRSTSMLGWGATVYAGQGFLILNPSHSQTAVVSEVDIDTGRGKKKGNFRRDSKEKIQKKLDNLLAKQKMGGAPARGACTHSEILYKTTNYDAIYFTQDPNIYNQRTYGSLFRLNDYTHYLQAIYLQQEYEAASGEKLPIFEYSGIHNQLIHRADPTDNDIVEIWEKMADAFLQDQSLCAIEDMSLEKLKVLMLYGSLNENIYNEPHKPCDTLYSPALRQRVDIMLHNKQQHHINEQKKQIATQIKDFPSSIFTDDFFAALLRHPELFIEAKEAVILAIETEIKSTAETEKFVYPPYRESDFNLHSFNCLTSIQMAYYYALLFNNNTLIKKIQDDATRFIETEFKSTSYKSFSETTVFNVINMALQYNIFDTHKEKILAYIIQCLDSLVKHNDIYEYRLIIYKIIDVGLLNNEIINHCNGAMQYFMNHLKDRSDYEQVQHLYRSLIAPRKASFIDFITRERQGFMAKVKAIKPVAAVAVPDSKHSGTTTCAPAGVTNSHAAFFAPSAAAVISLGTPQASPQPALKA